ncbi:CbtB-domain containing protein [bacterium]|nr:MAG: CbtB-domain containing protein [bacterium]
MDKTIAAWRILGLPESVSFLIKSGLLLVVSGFILYYLLGATYPPLHDTLHHFRHSLAIVPCH